MNPELEVALDVFENLLGKLEYDNKITCFIAKPATNIVTKIIGIRIINFHPTTLISASIQYARITNIIPNSKFSTLNSFFIYFLFMV